MEDARAEHDVLAIAKTIAANEFPVERASVIGVDRESGRLLRLSPFPWKGNDTDPPLLRWSWIHARTAKDERDVRPETVNVDGEVVATAYVDAKDAWRLRWPFVRPHVRPSLESLQALARDRSATVGFIRPAADGDVVREQLQWQYHRNRGEPFRHPRQRDDGIRGWVQHALQRVVAVGGDGNH